MWEGRDAPGAAKSLFCKTVGNNDGHLFLARNAICGEEAGSFVAHLLPAALVRRTLNSAAHREGVAVVQRLMSALHPPTPARTIRPKAGCLSSQ
jgi:hypothetical protein